MDANRRAERNRDYSRHSRMTPLSFPKSWPMMDSRSPDDLAAFEARLRGQVQGVGFRYFAQGLGRRLGLGGLVRNDPDGSVYVWAEGPRGALEEFLAHLRQGPPAAVVEACEVRWGAARGPRQAAPRFRIGYGDERSGG
jgi:acylphosphatase